MRGLRTLSGTRPPSPVALPPYMDEALLALQREDPAAWRRIIQGPVQALGWAADKMDRGGNAVRGLLVGQTGNLTNTLTGDNLLLSGDQSRYTSGRDVVDYWAGTENIPGFHPIKHPVDAMLDVLGFGTEIATDPLTYTFAIGPISKAMKLGKGFTTVANAAEATGKAAGRLGEIERMAASGSKGAKYLIERVGKYRAARAAADEAEDLLKFADESKAAEKDLFEEYGLMAPEAMSADVALKEATEATTKAKALGSDYFIPETWAAQGEAGLRKLAGVGLLSGITGVAEHGVTGQPVLDVLSKASAALQTAPLIGPTAAGLRRAFSTGRSREAFKDILDESRGMAGELSREAQERLAKVFDAAKIVGMTEPTWDNIIKAVEDKTASGPLMDAVTEFNQWALERFERPELGAGLKQAADAQQARLAPYERFATGTDRLTRQADAAGESLRNAARLMNQPPADYGREAIATAERNLAHAERNAEQVAREQGTLLFGKQAPKTGTQPGAMKTFWRSTKALASKQTWRANNAVDRARNALNAARLKVEQELAKPDNFRQVDLIWNPATRKFQVKFIAKSQIQKSSPIAKAARARIRAIMDDANRLNSEWAAKEAEYFEVMDEVAQNSAAIADAMEKIPGYFAHDLTEEGRMVERFFDHIPNFGRIKELSTVDPISKTRQWGKDIMGANGEVLGKVPYTREEVGQRVREQLNEALKAIDIEPLRRMDPAEVKAVERVARGEAEYFSNSPIKAMLASLDKGVKAQKNRTIMRRVGEEFGIPAKRVEKLRGMAPDNPDAARLLQEIEAGYEQVAGELWKDWYLPKDIAAEVANVEGKFASPEWAQKLFKALNSVNHLYKSALTIYFPAFHVRNTYSNVMLNALGGVWKPSSYKRAAEYLLYEASGGKMGRAVEVAGKSHEQVKRLLRELDVESTAFITGELGEVPMKAGMGKAREALSKFHGKVRAGSSKVENFARIAHFIEKLEDGMTPEAAAKSVKKYLFDYGDLTDFEKTYMRSAILFYSFTRRNMELQLETMLKRPGIYSAYGRLYAANIDRNAPGWEQEGLNIEIAGARLGAFGTPVDEFFSHIISKPDLAATLKATMTRNAGMLSPVFKYPLEAGLTEKSMFFDAPISENTKAPEIYASIPGLAQWLNLYRDSNGVLRGDPERLHTWRTLSPASRFERNISQFFDKDKDLKKEILQQVIGTRFSANTQEPDPKNVQKWRAREELQRMYEQGRVKKYERLYIPAGEQGRDPAAEAMAALAYRR